MAALDSDALAREAEALLKRLDDLRRDLEAMQRELRRAAEQKAQELVAQGVPLAQQEAAQALVTRGVRICDEVGAWLVGRSPLGLAQRLLPELRAGAEEVQAFLRAGDGAKA